MANKEDRTIPEEYKDIENEINNVYENVDCPHNKGIYICQGTYINPDTHDRLIKFFSDRGFRTGIESCSECYDPQCNCNRTYYVVRW